MKKPPPSVVVYDVAIMPEKSSLRTMVISNMVRLLHYEGFNIVWHLPLKHFVYESTDIGALDSTSTTDVASKIRRSSRATVATNLEPQFWRTCFCREYPRRPPLTPMEAL